MPTIDAQIFRLRREVLGLSQEALHDRSGIGIMTIKRIEACREGYPCRPNTIRKLASALAMEVTELEHDGLEHALDIGGDVEALLSKSMSEAELKEGSDALMALLLKKLRLIKYDPYSRG